MDNTNVGPANDGAIVGAYFVFADADDGEASKQLLASNVNQTFTFKLVVRQPRGFMPIGVSTASSTLITGK